MLKTVSEPSRLDQALQKLFPELSRRLARIAILEGRVRLNGKVAKIIARTVKAGDSLSVEGAAAPGLVAAPEREEIEVLYADSELLVVVKPAHVLSERVPHENGKAITDLLQRRFGALSLVHRLDAGTSGVMLLARTPLATEKLSDEFRGKRVSKIYLLLCKGAPGEGRYDGPLGRDPEHPRRMAVRPEGKASATRHRQLAVKGEVAFCAAYPETGRTHQIRVHFATAGHPLLGDVLYSGPSKVGTTLFRRALLHAFSLSFQHPKSGKAMTFSVAPPADFMSAFDQLVGGEVLSKLIAAPATLG